MLKAPEFLTYKNIDKSQNSCRILNYISHRPMAKKTKEKKVRYYLTEEGRFVIENYNLSKPFANFFPGIAGKYGIPLWAFYVNRAQGISCLGIKDKDHAILEYYPVNKAWQTVSTHGFRTFIKVNSGSKSFFYEPFHNGFTNLGFDIENRMLISAAELAIEETNRSLGLQIKVEYFGIPNSPFAALARIVTLKNASRSSRSLQMLDGLSQILPFGTNEFCQKKMSRTIEAWMEAQNMEKKTPFFKLMVDPADRPEVTHIHEGHFYLGFAQGAKKSGIIRPIINPDNVFGEVLDLSLPYRFVKNSRFAPPKSEILKSKTPCSFVPVNVNLAPGKEFVLCALVGHARNKELLNDNLAMITSSDYLALKRQENNAIISNIQDDIFTSSGSRVFDLYCRQTYLDNVLRGGYPTVFASKGQRSVFYLYSRKHGDLERDYNNFQLQPTYFSQGNGNYRDANQNRRNDAWFNPDIAEENLLLFFNLIQADGFNPLVVKGVNFSLNDEVELAWKLKDHVCSEDLSKIIAFTSRPFSPGELIMFLETKGISSNLCYDDMIGAVISCCSKIQEAEHGEGFWTDHWTYNLDLLESFLALYPEKYREIFFENKQFTFFDNTETVKPRCEKYLLRDGHPRQSHALAPDTAKKELIRKRGSQPHLLRDNYGHGKIYYTSLINKLLCILANKLSSLDPFGTGVEMEADKPSWFDALNGLPALFGSSVSETLELKRLVLVARKALKDNNIEKVNITEEIKELLWGIWGILKNNAGNEAADIAYWDESSTLKEEYRQKTKFGFSGRETEVSASQLLELLDAALEKLDHGINKAYDRQKQTYCSYLINEVTKYSIIRDSLIKVDEFRQKKVALFLEAPVHALRLARDKQEARALYEAVRKSALYDKKLKMYKITESLKDMPMELGRCRVFPPGWLENESVWLHMEYKFLLELLKQGLYEEFYAEFKNILICFQDPKAYGRSILENSSFLVSSAFPEKQLHGNGFVARLSGSTAELIHLWLMMNLGPKPFYLDISGNLTLRLQPIIAGWLFDKKGNYSFNFLRTVRVNYINPSRRATFGSKASRITTITFTDAEGKDVALSSSIIPAPYADQIRSRRIKEINVYLE